MGLHPEPGIKLPGPDSQVDPIAEKAERGQYRSQEWTPREASLTAVCPNYLHDCRDRDRPREGRPDRTSGSSKQR